MEGRKLALVFAGTADGNWSLASAADADSAGADV